MEQLWFVEHCIACVKKKTTKSTQDTGTRLSSGTAYEPLDSNSNNKKIILDKTSDCHLPVFISDSLSGTLMFHPMLSCCSRTVQICTNQNVIVQEKWALPWFALSPWNLMDCTRCSEGALIGLLITSMTDTNTRVEQLAAPWVCVSHKANGSKPSYATLRKYASWYWAQRVLRTRHESPMLTLGTWQVTTRVFTGYVMWKQWGKPSPHPSHRWYELHKKHVKRKEKLQNDPGKTLHSNLNFPFCYFILPTSNSRGSPSTLFFSTGNKIWAELSCPGFIHGKKINTSLTRSSWQVNFKAS